jgi:hypothetical protein
MKKVIKLTESDLTNIIKRVIEESNELKEIGGISTAARSWSEILVSEIKKSETKDFSIIGKDFPKAYENFPVDKFKVKFLPIGAFGYDQDNSGFIGNDYVVTLVVDPRLAYKIETSIINHEMKHAYQDFKRYENKSVGIKDSRFIKDMYTNDFQKFIVGFTQGKGGGDRLITLLYLYYILSNVEQDAYLENIYDEGPKGSMWGYGAQVISSIKLLDNLNNTTLNEKTWEELKRADIPFIKKFKSKEEFASYSERYLKNLAEKFKKKINKMKYLNFQQDNEKQSERKLTNNPPKDFKAPDEPEKQFGRKLSDKDLEDIKNNFNNQGSIKNKDEESPFIGGHSWEDIKNAFNKN